MSAAQLLSLKTVMARLGVRRRAAMRLVTKGKLRALRIGKLWKVDPADLDAFIEEEKTALDKRTTRAAATPARPPSRARGFANRPGANRYH